MNITEAKGAVLTCMANGLVPFLKSSPGVGKSTLIKDIAKEYNLQLIDIRLAQLEAVDLHGFPHIQDGIASYAPMDIFPTTETPLPKGKEGWILFLDELPNASISTQQAAYRIILDREVGNYPLHEKCLVVAAGNREIDKSFVQPMPSALRSRMVHLNVDIDAEAWLEWAAKNQFDPRITAFIATDSSRLDSSATYTDDTYSCPRTWDFVNRIINNKEYTREIDQIIQGTIGVSMAADFKVYMKYFDQIPDLNDIFENPEQATVPDMLSLVYATLSSVASKITSKTAEKAMKYISRFPPEFQVMAYRDIINRHEFALGNKHITAWAKRIHKTLTGE